MTSETLLKITICLPRDHVDFNRRLASLLEPIGESRPGELGLIPSDPGFFPRLAIDFFSARSIPTADFLIAGGEGISLAVENTTGAEKKSPYSYGHLPIDAVALRFGSAGMKLIGIDHLGVNLPWFDPGPHPRILRLRETVKAQCLYHRYPTGEPWDFILPGAPEEIAGGRPIDYGKIRRPKFELVSFDKSSMPLIQIDLGVDGRYEEFKALFPEALADETFRNIWIYLENPHAVDVCLVINEYSRKDWSEFFKGCRS
jgi:hypothetical protein